MWQDEKLHQAVMIESVSPATVLYPGICNGEKAMISFGLQL